MQWTPLVLTSVNLHYAQIFSSYSQLTRKKSLKGHGRLWCCVCVCEGEGALAIVWYRRHNSLLDHPRANAISRKTRHSPQILGVGIFRISSRYFPLAGGMYLMENTPYFHQEYQTVKNVGRNNGILLYKNDTKRTIHWPGNVRSLKVQYGHT